MKNIITANQENESLKDMQLSQVVLPQTPLKPEDLADFRLPLGQSVDPVTRKGATTIKISRPQKGVFVRTHAKHKFDGFVIEDPVSQEPYLVLPAIAGKLQNECVAKRHILAVDRDGNPFIWPIRLPNEDGTLDSYSESALVAADEAERSWVRVQSNRSKKMYDTRVAVAAGGEPDWPEEDFDTLLSRAFGNRIIRDMDHPLVKRLNGEIIARPVYGCSGSHRNQWNSHQRTRF